MSYIATDSGSGNQVRVFADLSATGGTNPSINGGSLASLVTGPAGSPSAALGVVTLATISASITTGSTLSTVLAYLGAYLNTQGNAPATGVGGNTVDYGFVGEKFNEFIAALNTLS